GSSGYLDSADTMGSCSVAETFDADGRSVALRSIDGTLHRVATDGSTEPVAVRSSAETSYPKVIASCQGTILVADGEHYGVFAPPESEVAIVDAAVRGGCPLLSPDRRSVAWWAAAQPGPVVVSRATTGEAVEVARIGSPVS